MKKADLVALGKVVRSQGRDGRVKLKLNAKGPTGFEGATVYIRRPGGLEAFDVESLDLDRNSYFLKLKGVDTLAAADALAGTEILASGADFKRPGEDRYYDFEVIGCRVVTRDGAGVGDVAALLEAGEPDASRRETGGGGRVRPLQRADPREGRHRSPGDRDRSPGRSFGVE